MTAANGSGPGQLIPILAFAVDEQPYAFLITDVVEVTAMIALTEVATSSQALIGVANRHGNVLPMIDFRYVMRGVPVDYDSNSLFVVVQHLNMMIGVVVNEIQGVLYLPADYVRKPSGMSEFIHGIISYQDRIIQIVAAEPLVALYYSDDPANDSLKVNS